MSTFLINITIIVGSSVTPLITSHDGPMMHRPTCTHSRTNHQPVPARLADTRKEFIYIYVIEWVHIQFRPAPTTNALILLLILVLMMMLVS